MAITIIGNVGNVGFALPMASASPANVNNQYLLGWDPVQQALDYVPYVLNAFGDFTILRDLTVTRNMTVGGTASVAGIFSTGATAPLGAVIPFVTGGMTLSGALSTTQATAVSGGNNAILAPTQLSFQATKVVGTRQTGWVAMTGTPVKATRVTSTVTLPDLAGIVMALQADMIAHGLIGT